MIRGHFQPSECDIHFKGSMELILSEPQPGKPMLRFALLEDGEAYPSFGWAQYRSKAVVFGTLFSVSGSDPTGWEKERILWPKGFTDRQAKYHDEKFEAHLPERASWLEHWREKIQPVVETWKQKGDSDAGDSPVGPVQDPHRHLGSSPPPPSPPAQHPRR
ncbi:hypothetical protein BDP27DRAFT_1418502 [Rhodocollybia butyracea]|uniref:Uncharacterized protein n=1 Tax=Rhodocollybia butyracea TaxID=206335 RepID=A0A9P5U9E7_9AGAR|nr:hypothetical protein BDP27DRAFT_1418502 [Rhodocollybia butyracea]